MVLKHVKRIISLVLAIVLVFGGVFVIPSNSKAADDRYVEELQGIRYVKYKEYDEQNCPPLGIEPGRPGGAEEYEGANDEYGFLFGGWFVKRSGKYIPLQSKGDIQANDEVFAKYVPANVLSVKCQNFAETSDKSEATNVRIISAVDSLNYRMIGFELYRIKVNSDSTYTVTVIGSDGGQETKWTYDKLYIYDDDASQNAVPTEYLPADVFGGGAKYFTGWELQNIAKANFDKIIGVRPYWVTMDGVKVYGLSRYMHVRDGYMNYINVPVNLHNTRDVSAGILTFTYDTSKYELVGVECGRVFEELTTLERKTGTIECVANVGTATSKVSNDLYMNVVLHQKSVTDGINVSEFDVKDESFANYDEVEFDNVEYNVWKIQTGLIKKIDAK